MKNLFHGSHVWFLHRSMYFLFKKMACLHLKQAHVKIILFLFILSVQDHEILELHHRCLPPLLISMNRYNESNVIKTLLLNGFYYVFLPCHHY